MKIGILGLGNIGRTLGKKWAAHGHSVRFGVRDVSGPKYQAELYDIHGDVGLAPVADALAFGDVVVLAVPGSAVEDTMKRFGAVLGGKIIIDATNQVGQAELNSFATISTEVPSAKLYRAFSTLGWENFEQPEIQGEQIDLFFCGDENDPRIVVETLIGDIGLRPVYIGGRDQVGVVDGLTRLWFALAFQRGYGRRLAFKMQAP